MAAWKTEAHLVDHYYRHRGRLRCGSIEAYDASAQETISIGVRFTYIDPGTGESRIGYFHRDTSRMTATDADGFIVCHFLTAEDYVVTLERSTYRDD
jgi:hypothetical protein